MREAKGNMLDMDCDALVITTNGFVKSNGECVMGRGIAKQISRALPWIAGELGNKLNTLGNVPHFLGQHNNVDLVSFPVKPRSVKFDGSNAVGHAMSQFRVGESVPGFYAKADPQLIVESARKLVQLTDQMNWKTVLVPRFGCGAGELSWADIRPLVEPILDDRFIACTF